jgi:hypothetical protein
VKLPEDGFPFTPEKTNIPSCIKAGSPFKQTMIAELANGSIGYIPTRRAYTEGNYEVVSACCAEGSGELLVESAVRQLRKLYRN